jgi:YhgE/Pip-like protein
MSFGRAILVSMSGDSSAGQIKERELNKGAAHLIRKSLPSRLGHLLSSQSPRLVTAAVIVVPALLVGLPAAGMQDSLDRVSGLEVALVNDDASIATASGTTVSLGDGVIDQIRESGQFAWSTSTPATVGGGIEDGRFVAIVHIGRDFTAEALANGEDAALAEISVQTSGDLPQVVSGLASLVAAAVDTEFSAEDAAAGGSLFGDADADSPRERFLSGLAAAQTSNQTLHQSLGNLEDALLSTKKDANNSNERLRALRTASNSASTAADRASSLATTLNGAIADVAETFGSSRAILISEMQIQGLTQSQQSHVLAIYDRQANPIRSAQASAEGASGQLGAVADSLASVSTRIESVIQTDNADAIGDLLASVRESRASTSRLDDAFSAAIALAEGLDPSGAPPLDASGLDVSSATAGPESALDAARIAGLAAFALALGALLIAPFSARLGRHPAVDRATGMPVGAATFRSLVFAAGQGIGVGLVLSTGLHVGAWQGLLVVGASVLAGAALTATLLGLVLWFGHTGLYVGIGGGLVAWFLTAGIQPVATLPAPLRWLAEASPIQWARTMLHYFAFGDPFTGVAQVIIPVASLSVLAVVAVALGEQAHHSRRSWMSTRLADALANDD